MPRSVISWYYFLLFVAFGAAFILGDFSAVTPTLRLLVFFLLAFAALSPVVFGLMIRTPGSPSELSMDSIEGEIPVARKTKQELEDKLKELAESNKHLAEIDEAKSHFVSMTTHQLRTPLAAIKWTFHMLLGESLGKLNEDQRHFLQKGYDSADRIINVINDWLNVDYINANRGDYQYSRVALGPLLNGLIADFEHRLVEKHLHLTFNKPNGEISAEVDPAKIRMAFENLLDNAIKYTPVNGAIVVQLNNDKSGAPAGHIEVLIKDSGIGIPPAEQPRIFSRFYRSSNAMKLHQHGSGLGLFIVKDIVERHQGKIWFESDGQNGTVFHVALPINQK